MKISQRLYFSDNFLRHPTMSISLMMADFRVHNVDVLYDHLHNTDPHDAYDAHDFRDGTRHNDLHNGGLYNKTITK